ncbi:WASH complex subunit 2A isoform X16 [Manis pentadactyla]|uniref:WASH complex subunit 2A isoform X16 n=1 Tax=Manis pentadactyla TaxID=143292 RepID=UPI00255D0644|nr:WASH complex subunit 2A isoform X16 [Manis pentadactyla]
MNGITPGQERTPASEPVWERPWSVEEIRRSSQSWSLAADAGLLQFLQEFSQQTISRTHEIKKQVDGLIRETKATDCRLHNVFNDFLMLSNTQFIENRVYDEEVEEPVLKPEAEKAEQEKTREQKEVDLIPKVQEAVNYGLQVLDSAFEQLDIKAGNSDSEEDDANERVELILEPKDLYIDRPLPYLIGSKLFMEQEDVGLGELSSEEGSVGSDRGSIVDSDEENEEEESDEDFANRSDNDQNRHTAQMSDEEEEDDGCDIFADSEKEEEDTEDTEENTRPTKSRPTSFADELAARINGGAWSQKEEEQINEGDNFFVPPKLTDEDFSPFGSRGGLFSGGKGLFDGEEESDLFTEAPQDQEARASINAASSSSIPAKKIPAGAVSVFLGDTDVFGATSAPSLKEPQKHEQPTAGQSPYLAAPTGLFDDTDDDNTFFAASSSKSSMTEKVTSIANIFDDEEGYLFKDKAVALPEATVNQTDEHQARAKKKIAISSSKNLKLSSETKTQKGLFSDEEDSEDLFSSQNVSKPKDASLLPSKPPMSASFFDDEDEEDNLFGTTAGKKQTSSLLTQSQEKSKSSEPSRKKASALLFSSDDEEDQWNITDSQTNSSSDNRSKGELRDSGTTQVQEAKAVKKTSLFEDDDEDDLFVIAKDSRKKTQRVSLLFEEDADSGSSLFGSPPASVPPATKEGPLTLSSQQAAKHSDLLSSSSPLDKGTKNRTKTVLSLYDEEEDKTEDQSSIQVPKRVGTSRVKVRGKRRPQTRAARRLAAQESSEAEDMSVPKGSVAQLADGTISPDRCQPQPTAGGKDSEEAVATATPPWAGGPVLGMDGNSFAKSLGQPHKDDIFDSEDIFSKGSGSQSTGRKTVLVKAAESLATLPGGSKEKSSVFPALGEAGSDDDLFQSVTPKPTRKTNPFPLLKDEDDLFIDQKGKKNESKSNHQQDVISKSQDIFELNKDDIFATEAIQPSQKTREKERTFESNLFDDNIDIFADLTVKPKEKSKKKVEAKSIFADDMDDIFSSGVQAKTTKPKSRSSQAVPELKSEQKVSNIFDDPLNAFGDQ